MKKALIMPVLKEVAYHKRIPPNTDQVVIDWMVSEGMIVCIENGYWVIGRKFRSAMKTRNKKAATAYCLWLMYKIAKKSGRPEDSEVVKNWIISNRKGLASFRSFRRENGGPIVLSLEGEKKPITLPCFISD